MDLTHSEDFYINRVLRKTRLREIMTCATISVRVDALFIDVVRIFEHNNIRHLPIVDAKARVVGLMTQRELFKIHSPRKLEDGSWHYDPQMVAAISLQHVMIKNPFVLHADSTVAEAIMPMVRHKCGCIPIVEDNGVLCGIVTQHDVLKMALMILEEAEKVEGKAKTAKEPKQRKARKRRAG